MDESKPFYLSRSLWGVIITLLSGLVGSIFGIEVDADTQAWLVDQTVAVISGAFGLAGLMLAAYGRLKALKRIGKATPPTALLVLGTLLAAAVAYDAAVSVALAAGPGDLLQPYTELHLLAAFIAGMLTLALVRWSVRRALQL